MKFSLCFILLTNVSKHQIASKRIKGDTMKRKSLLLCTLSLAALLAGTPAPVTVQAEEEGNATTVQVPAETTMTEGQTTTSAVTSRTSLSSTESVVTTTLPSASV